VGREFVSSGDDGHPVWFSLSRSLVRGSRSASTTSDQSGNGFPLEVVDPEGHDAAVCGEHARQAGSAQRGHACCGSPGRAGTERTFSRVGFLGAGLVAAAAAAGIQANAAVAAGPTQVWGLEPGGGCCGTCAACRAHAANKLFAHASDADAGRAHPFCRCTVVPLLQVDRSVYDALFSNGGARPSVDRRFQWVQAVLAQAQVQAPAPTQTEPPSPPSDSSAPEHRHLDRADDLPDRVVLATLGRVRLVRDSRGGRRIYADVSAAETVTAELTALRSGKSLVHRKVGRFRGRRTLELAIPGTVGVGPALLRLDLQDSAGNPLTVTAPIRIPGAELRRPSPRPLQTTRSRRQPSKGT
jgi:hypothetical protein